MLVEVVSPDDSDDPHEHFSADSFDSLA